jgi:hypothetical protein
MKKLTRKIIERLTGRGHEKGYCDPVDATCHAEVGMMTRLFGDAGRQIALDR